MFLAASHIPFEVILPISYFWILRIQAIGHFLNGILKPQRATPACLVAGVFEGRLIEKLYF